MSSRKNITNAIKEHEGDFVLTVASIMTTLSLWQTINVKPPALLDFIEVTEVDADKIYKYMNMSMVMVLGIAGLFAMVHGKRGFYIPSIAALATGTAMYIWTDSELKLKRGMY